MYSSTLPELLRLFPNNLKKIVQINYFLVDKISEPTVLSTDTVIERLNQRLQKMKVHVIHAWDGKPQPKYMRATFQPLA